MVKKETIKAWLLKTFFDVDLNAITDEAVNRDNEIKLLKLETQRLNAELLGSERRFSKRISIVAATVGDPEPQGKDRADYIAQTTNFYNSIGKKKLLHLIAVTRENLDSVFQDVPHGMDRTRLDDLLRGSSNAFKTLMDWFELLEGEHKQSTSNQGANE